MKTSALLGLLLCASELAAEPYGDGREATPAVVNPAIRSALRQTISLDGAWDFATDPKQEGDQQKWFAPAMALPGHLHIQVPGCWEAQGVGGPGNSVSVTPEQQTLPLRGAYVGTAWYRNELTLPAGFAGKELWLKVGGVHAQGWFWVNGTYLHHDASYCGAYKYNITDLIGADRKVVVAMKVRNDLPSGKGLFGWLHRFGGPYRSVEIDATPARFVDDAYVEGNLDRKCATAHVKLRSTASTPSEVELEATVSTLDGQQAGYASSKFMLTAGQAQDLALEIGLSPFNPWWSEHPNLYRADIVLKAEGKPIDGWVERFGVRQWEVRGGSFYLNNSKYFVRGFGDDWVYPLTICSPASRDYHRQHLQLAKAYGFDYVRHHTHCELPEFFDAADEMGIMVQPELPYYGSIPSAGDQSWFRPKEDLAELITHYRRHVSLSTYCTGNEGHLGSPMDKEIYQLGKRLDPTRLFQHQDGGRSTPENSDFRTGPSDLWEPGGMDDSRPFFAHEYLNLAVSHDPRLAPKYTGAQLPPAPLEPFQAELAKVGLPLRWGYACLDAGHQLQRIYQKRGLESARLDPVCDGYIYWTMMDVGFSGDQGLLTQFWDAKASTPEYFRQFNGPTAILAKTLPAERILAEGADLKVDWWISPFDWTPVRDSVLAWKLTAAGRELLSGRLTAISANAGEVKSLGQSLLKIPALARPVKAELVAELEGTSVKNSWEVWLFPHMQPRADAGKGLAAPEKILASIAGRYPGVARSGTPEAANASVVLANYLDGAAVNALEQGKRVLLLRLAGQNPGVGLGWWAPGPQTGTAVARHPAFGDFPHDGYLNELFFRLIGNAVPLRDGGYEQVEPLLVGHGNLGYLLHVFEAKAGHGKLLASGLNLLSGTPEADYLLDQFIQYVRSDRFDPTGTLDLAREKARVEAFAKLHQSLNGWSRTIETRHTVSYPSFLGPMNMSVVRLGGPQNLLRWHTTALPDDLQGKERYTFKWLVGMGYLSQPSGKFRLRLHDRPLVEFEVVEKTAKWKSPDGTVELEYEVRQANTEDTSGIMRLTLPSNLLHPGQEAELQVILEQNGSLRWFSVYEAE